MAHVHVWHKCECGCGMRVCFGCLEEIEKEAERDDRKTNK